MGRLAPSGRVLSVPLSSERSRNFHGEFKGEADFVSHYIEKKVNATKSGLTPNSLKYRYIIPIE
jgi:hypothetical protein